jgi:hypothetical protein
MPLIVKKIRNKNLYKVSNKLTGEIYAYGTKDPQKLISAIEINKMKSKKKK